MRFAIRRLADASGASKVEMANSDHEHVCIRHPCAYCAIRNGGGDEEPGQRREGVLPFRARPGPATREERLVHRMGSLSPAQRAAVEALVDLYLG